MVSENSLNNLAWNQIFKEHDILMRVENEGCYKIRSKEINKYRESRLMAKFDHKVNLPEIFTDNHLSILPISRGSYIIAKIETHRVLENITDDIIPVEFIPNIESINPTDLYSESAALHCAHICRMLEDLFDEVEFKQTISGRMASSIFEFKIKNSKGNYVEIRVEDSQCEIDGGFESRDKIILIEVKNHLPTDSLVRQLYYLS